MNYFSCTVVADGPSDRALVPIVRWILKGCTDQSFDINFACSYDARSHDLYTKVQRALALYPCEILFVHRDAEHPGRSQDRHREIEGVEVDDRIVVVPIVPVRMTEAWLLFNEQALRSAAGNPNGSMGLGLPNVRATEGLLDPKEEVLRVLRAASGRQARRLKSFNESQAKSRIAELIDDFSPLRALGAFQDFERRTTEAVRRI